MDAKLNHSDLSTLLAKELNISIAKSEQFTKAFFDLVIEGLAEDGIVKINGLGTFRVADVASRSSVDVNTGAKIEIKGHKKLTFTPADSLKEEVNRPFAMFEPVEVDESYQDDAENGGNEEDETATIPAETVQAVETAELQSECGVTEEHEESCARNTAPVVDDVQGQDAVAVAENVADDATVIDAAMENVQAAVADNVQEQDVVHADETTIDEEQTPMEDTPKAETAENVPAGENISVETSADEPAKSRGFSWRRNANWITVVVMAVAVLLIILRRSSDGQQPVVVDTEKCSVVAGNDSKAQEVSAATVHPVPQDTVQSAEPVEEAPYVFEMVPELAGRNLKTITMADTLHYVAVGDWTVHKVGSDETLVRIAKKYYGDKKLWPYLAMYNKLWNPDGLNRNMTIVIPKLKPRK